MSLIRVLQAGLLLSNINILEVQCKHTCSQAILCNSKKIYIPKNRIFQQGQGREIIVYIKGHALSVPRLYNNDDKRGFFILQKNIGKKGMQLLEKGKLWQCWCGAVFTSRDDLQQHYWEEAHGRGTPNR